MCARARPSGSGRGPALPLTTLEIVDIETGVTVLGTGEIGEIRARARRSCPAIAQARETAEALRPGYLYTGDIGELDADGYLFIRDRKKDMVIVGGYNVYPREVDEVLFSTRRCARPPPPARPTAIMARPFRLRGANDNARVAADERRALQEEPRALQGAGAD